MTRPIDNDTFNALPEPMRKAIIDTMHDEIHDMPSGDVVSMCLSGMSPDELQSYVDHMIELPD